MMYEKAKKGGFIMINHATKKQELMDAFNFRHATKTFDPAKKISEEDFHIILEAGRLSPSSIGYEPWKFLVVQNREIREKLREVSSGAQGQFPTASHFVIILARKNATPESDYGQHILKSVKKVPDDKMEQMVKAYQHFQGVNLNLYESERALFDWASKQTYIALGNMLTAAALIGIDSCPIEGFHMEKVNEVLENEGLLDRENFSVSVMAAFGYRAEEPHREKSRQSQDEVVQWVD